MSNLQTLTNDRLRLLISESEATILELKTELEHREHVQQNHDVADLENHMNSAELSLKTIRDFLAFLSQDYSLKHGEDI